MFNAVVVFLGGGIGSFGRYWLQGVVYRWTNSGFPYGTLAVNVIGSFIIGLLAFVLEDRFLVAPSLRVFLLIGILGGFTTFSSFSYETVMMLKEGEVLYALLNVGYNVALCLGATYAGIVIGKLI